MPFTRSHHLAGAGGSQRDVEGPRDDALGVGEQLDTGVATRVLLDRRRRSIGRGAVDDDDLEVLMRLREDRVEAPPDRSFFVAGRNHDGHELVDHELVDHERVGEERSRLPGGVHMAEVQERLGPDVRRVLEGLDVRFVVGDRFGHGARFLTVNGAISAVFSTVLPTFLISEGIKRINASNAAIIGSSGPIFTIILSSIFLKETISMPQFIGTCMVLIGVFLVGWKGKQ